MKKNGCILFLTRRYFPHVGGVEKHVQNVAELLAPEHRVVVVTERHNSTLNEHEWIKGVQVVRMPMRKGKPSKIMIWFWWLRHLHLLWWSDVIHIHDVFFWILPFRLLFFWKKMYMTFHGYEAPGPPKGTQVFWHKVAAFMTRKNLCVGNFHEKWYGVNADLVTHGGVTEESELTQKLKRKNTRHGAVFIGRVEKDTSIMMYLEAIRILKEHKIIVPLDVYGEGTLLKQAKAFVQRYQLPVDFRGAILNAGDLYDHYQVACSSGYLSMLEALSVGTGVIATYETEIKKDYLTLSPFAKWITIAATPEEIARALRERVTVDLEGVKWARSQTWQKLKKQYLQLWSSKK